MQSVYRCSLCPSIALTAEVTRDPNSPDKGHLHFSGFLWSNHTETVTGHMLDGVEAALAGGDIRALYALNELWAPCYCPECDATYCRQHWHIEMEFDDDFPGWYDCAYGTCPNGHRRLVDD